MSRRFNRTSLLLAVATILAGCAGEASRRPMTYEQRQEHFAEHKAELLTEFDLSNARVDTDELFSPGIGRDGIQSLDSPERVAAAGATFPADDARVVEVVINGDAVAYPLDILNVHEIANDTVGNVPVAVTYCPLCDSVSVVDRRLPGEDTVVTELGVSGMLWRSNLVMYDRTTDSLWSQADMRAATGPYAGYGLTHLPVRVVTFERFKADHSDGEVIGGDPEHAEEYEANFYEEYFSSDDLYMPVEHGDALAPKTLGIGVKAGEYTAFITADAAREYPVSLLTPLGRVMVSANEAGMTVEAAPSDVQTMQVFYFAWSANHPGTRIIAAPESISLLDGQEKSFLINGYSTSYAWPDMLQEMLDEHAGGERVYHVLNSVVGGAAVEIWIAEPGSNEYERTVAAMDRDFYGETPRLRAEAPLPRIALCQQSLQFTRTQRGPIAQPYDWEGIDIGADAMADLVDLLKERGIERVYMGTHIYKGPIEPEVGNERLALAELLRREHPGVYAGADTWTPTRDQFDKAFADDGVHPNAYGMKLMAELWYRTVAGPDTREDIIENMHDRKYDTETMMRDYIRWRRGG